VEGKKKKDEGRIMSDTFKGVLGAEEIMELIPYRYPMMMLDRVVELEKDKFAKAYKNVSAGEVHFQGHFPGHPIMPGVLIIEAIAQASVVMWAYFNQDNKEGKVVYFSSLEMAKFRKPVVPGDVLEVQVHLKRRIKNIWKFRGEAFVEGQLVAEAVFSAALIDLNEKNKK
jgi:3-hydroxyacyl-[acyl-carrier-protein] dehydratase